MLSKKIKEYRQQNGLTQKDLAEKLFVSRSAVAKWEQGKGIPSKDILSNLCLIMNCTKDELLNEDEAVIIIENVNKSSNKKVFILLFISVLLLAGIIIATFFAVNIRINGKIIATSFSPDNQIVLTVYDKPQPSTQYKNGGYTIKVSGKNKGTWVKENCRFIGLYWSDDSRYVIEEFYSDDIKQRWFEYTDFQSGGGVNLQGILNEKLKSHYSLNDEDVEKTEFKFIRWDSETHIILFYFDLYHNDSRVSGYFWSSPNLWEPLKGLVEINNSAI